MKKYILAVLMMISLSAFGQKFDKGDLAHIEAGSLLTSTTYFVVSAAGGDDMQKIVIPIAVANAIGIGKEIWDSTKPNNYFSATDIIYNNAGIFATILLIEGGKLIGIPERIMLGTTMAIGTVSLGLTVSF